MKPSGVDWIGDIPDNWSVTRANSLFSKVKRVQQNENVLSLSYGRVINKKVGNAGLVPDNYESYQGIEPGDIVLRLTDLQNDERSIRVAHSDLSGIITSAYLAVKTDTSLNATFGYFLLHTAGDINKIFYSLGGGVRQTMKFNDIARMSLLLPPIKEQTSIIKYINDRTTTIDSKIQVLEEKATALAELRKSVIHQAVTKGLDSTVAMKPSGVDWIGDVPAHWCLARNKDMATFQNGYPFAPNDWSDEGTPIIRIKNLNKGSLDNFYAGVLPAKYIVMPGDILYAWSGTIDVFKWAGPEAYLNQHIFKVTPTINEKFYFWQATAFNPAIRELAHGSTMMHIQLGPFKNLVGVLPPDNEKLAIAAYLDERTTVIDESIKTINEQVATLKALRQSLIHEAVTGKIDVADFGYTTA